MSVYILKKDNYPTKKFDGLIADELPQICILFRVLYLRGTAADPETMEPLDLTAYHTKPRVA